jgi:hypothetical protein
MQLIAFNLSASEKNYFLEKWITYICLKCIKPAMYDNNTVGGLFNFKEKYTKKCDMRYTIFSTDLIK